MTEVKDKPQTADEIASQFTVFAICDREGEAPYRQGVFAAQEQQHVVGNRVVNEKSYIVTPNDAGLYIVPPGHEFAEKTIIALEAKQERENKQGMPPRIIGPFVGKSLSDITQEALKAVVKARPLSDKEAAFKYKIGLAENEKDRAAEREASETRIKELEAALAEKEKADKPDPKK